MASDLQFWSPNNKKNNSGASFKISRTRLSEIRWRIKEMLGVNGSKPLQVDWHLEYTPIREAWVSNCLVMATYGNLLSLSTSSFLTQKPVEGLTSKETKIVVKSSIPNCVPVPSSPRHPWLSHPLGRRDSAQPSPGIEKRHWHTRTKKRPKGQWTKTHIQFMRRFVPVASICIHLLFWWAST